MPRPPGGPGRNGAGLLSADRRPCVAAFGVLPTGEHPGTAPAMTDATPTPRDTANAELRRQIADRLAGEYAEDRALAGRAFGPGWEPVCRHFLIDRDEEER